MIVFLSFVSLIFIARATTQANAKSEALQVEINKLNQEEQGLIRRVGEVEKSLTAEQMQTLTAAHVLVDRKRFSWSRLFVDLEAILPGSVRVSRVSVRDVVAREGQTVAELDLAVFAKTPSTVTDMIEQMAKTGIFQAYLQSQNLQKGRGESGTEYELYVIYTPRAGAPSDNEATANVASIEATGGKR